MKRDADEALKQFYVDCRKAKSEESWVKSGALWCLKNLAWTAVGVGAACLLVLICSLIPVRPATSPLSPLFRNGDAENLVRELEPPKTTEKEEHRCDA